MEKLFFLLRQSKWLSGGEDTWSMGHSLWYVNESGFTLGIILTLLISLFWAASYYQLLPRIWANMELSRVNWFLFMVINATVVLFVTLLVARSGIIDYAAAKGYLTEQPHMRRVLNGFTMDMWLYALQSALYSVVAFFGLSFLCRIKSVGRYIPF